MVNTVLPLLVMSVHDRFSWEKRTGDVPLPVGVAIVAPLPAKVDLVPSPAINPEKPKRFFVTLEMICHPKANGPWVKNYELKNKVIVIPDLIKDDTIQTLQMKIKRRCKLYPRQAVEGILPTDPSGLDCVEKLLAFEERISCGHDGWRKDFEGYWHWPRQQSPILLLSNAI